MKILLGLVLAIGLAGCGEAVQEAPVNTSALEEIAPPTETEIIESMRQLHEELFREKGNSLNQLNATTLLDQALLFEARFQSSENRLEALKYGEAAARGMGHLTEANKFLKIILKENPEIEDRPFYLSLRAHTLNELGQPKEATKIYQQIVDEFPGTDWAVDAQGNLTGASIEMTDEEMIEFLDKVNS